MIAKAKKAKPEGVTEQMAAVCRVLVEVATKRVTRGQLESCFGKGHFGSLTQIAKVFGMAQGTVRTWRQNGLPGKDGKYPIAGVVAWRINAKVAEVERKVGTVSSENQAIKSLEVRKLQVEVDKKEREEAIARGQLVASHDLYAAVSAMVAVAQENVLTVPRQLVPAYGAACGQEIARLLSNIMLALSEKTEREFVSEAGHELPSTDGR